jgi:hypothetical protein
MSHFCGKIGSYAGCKKYKCTICGNGNFNPILNKLNSNSICDSKTGIEKN